MPVNRSSTSQLLSAAILLSLAAAGAQAADRSDLHQRNIQQLRQQYQSVTASQGVASMANRRHAQFMRADASTTLLMQRKRSDRGVTNYRYHQAWRGIPIFGQDIVVSEDILFDFYDARVGADVVSGAHFEQWWKRERQKRPRLLDFDPAMLTHDTAEEVTIYSAGGVLQRFAQDFLESSAAV